MNLDINYQSQEPLEKSDRKDWCGLACLYMVLNFYLQNESPSLSDLHQKFGTTLEAKTNFQTVGLEHKDILRIAREYGLKGFRKSWWAEPGVFPLFEKFLAEGESEEEIEKWMRGNKDEGVFALKKAVSENMPVIVSMDNKFAQTKTTHLVLVKGFNDNKIIVHDPYKNGADFSINEEDFKNHWLRQAIFIYR